MQQFILAVSIFSAVLCSPFDDGKYRPKKYDEYDDGKYYRPLDEGKYIPGDEGRYTYIYQQGVWPYDGTYKYMNEKDDPYMGYRVYASRYPYVHGVIKGLVSKYVSSDSVNFGEATEGSTNHYSKVYADKEVAVKCQYIMPESNKTEFTTQYPPHMNLEKGEKLGSFYSFKGTKVLSTVKNALTNKLKLQYEVFVRVVDDVSLPSESDEVTPAVEELKSPLLILRPPSVAKVESTTNTDVKSSISEIVKSLIIEDVLPTVSGVPTAEDLKLTIDDVQLLPNDDAKPTMAYAQTLSNDELKPTTDSVEVSEEDDSRSTLSDVQVLTDVGDNILIIDLQSSTEAGQR
ncbi:unnamed protein product, partial [Iphiclides podalirius]